MYPAHTSADSVNGTIDTPAIENGSGIFFCVYEAGFYGQPSPPTSYHGTVYAELSTLSFWRDVVIQHSYTASNEQSAIVQAISSLAQA